MVHGGFLSDRMVCGSRSRSEFRFRSGNLLVGRFLVVGILCFVSVCTNSIMNHSCYCH